eukprot:gene1598-32987_t
MVELVGGVVTEVAEVEEGTQAKEGQAGTQAKGGGGYSSQGGRGHSSQGSRGGGGYRGARHGGGYRGGRSGGGTGGYNSQGSNFGAPSNDSPQSGLVLLGLAGKKKGNFFGKAVLVFTPAVGGDLPFHRFSSGDLVMLSRNNPLTEKPFEGSLLDRGRWECTG